MQKKFLPKLVIASILVGGVNFAPVNFNAENLQIVSVAYAKVEKVTASGRAIFNFGENDAQIVNTVKNVAKMRAIQAAKENAGFYVKSFSQTVNGVLTADDISAYASNNIEILNVTYKKIPVQAHDVKGNDTGEIAFMYEATVTAKIDTSGLTAYIQRDDKEKEKIVENNQSSQENIEKISNEFDNLRNSTKDVEQIKSDMNKIDRKILAQQKIDEGDKQRNNDDAILKYMEAIEIAPDYLMGYERLVIDAYFGMATYDFEKEKFYKKDFGGQKHLEQAIYFADQAVKNLPNDGEAYYLRAKLFCFISENVYNSIFDNPKKRKEFDKKAKADLLKAKELGYYYTGLFSIFRRYGV